MNAQEPIRILLKLTGEILLDTQRQLTGKYITHIVAQIKQLKNTHQFGIVIGGGNFFRGSVHRNAIGIRPAIAHQVGMLATIANGLIMRDLCLQQDLPAVVLSTVAHPEVDGIIADHTIAHAQAHNQLIIFVGGTGNPYFTTDTSAVLRGLQMDAREIWKGTLVDGIYNKDPKQHSDAIRYDRITYAQALAEQLAILDATAIAFAQTHHQTIRVFTIFEPNALITAAHDNLFGSTLVSSL